VPKTSADSASQVRDFGVALDRTEELDGQSISFVSIRETHDLAPMLKGLPGDSCQCPHWGYVFKGRVTWSIGGRDEVCEAGDAFYVPPGHTVKAEGGTEILQFSPTEELHATEAAIQANMQKMQSA